MVKRDQLIGFIKKTIGSDLLNKANKVDHRANGFQVLGNEDVSKVVLGVTLSDDFLKEAVEAEAQFCIFHHGLGLDDYQSILPSYVQKRLELIFKNDLTIGGFHYSLDAHPKIGNNAVIIRELGADQGEPFFEDWGFVATFKTSKKVDALLKQCASLFEHDIFAVLAGPKAVTKIGVCSGGAKPFGENAAELEAKGIELFITGEPGEPTPNIVKEMGINYFAGGHYATEVFGVQELGKVLKQEYKDKLEVEFIDIPNPI
jgi:dinuclear metal center YbgI/SA1388 family protein